MKIEEYKEFIKTLFWWVENLDADKNKNLSDSDLETLQKKQQKLLECEEFEDVIKK